MYEKHVKNLILKKLIMILKKFLKIKINDFIYIFSILIISYFLLNIYKLKSSKNIERSEPGFRSAEAINASKDLCIVSSKNIDCQNNIFLELKKNEKSILFLGNSQMGAINEFESGDLSFLSLLSKKFESKKSTITIKGLWLPNANLKEFEVINQGLLKCDISPKLLIIPVFLDDTRINGIRNELDNYPSFICKPQKLSSLKTYNNSSNLKKLDENIEKKFKLFKELKSLNERFRIDIYKLRNYIFNIKPTTVRNIRKPFYNNNIKALKNIINFRVNKNLKTIVYIPPLLISNNGGAIPYKRIDYSNFKNQISSICNSQNCIYFNLENEVPKDLWGLKMSTNFKKQEREIDFMHFKGKGHEIFADKFFAILENNLQ